MSGYLLLLDLRMNILSGIYHFKRREKKVPLFSVNNFIASDHFVHSLRPEAGRNYLMLTYLSDQSEFSIFNMGSYDSSPIAPSFHFHCSNTSTDMSDEGVQYPYLECVMDSEKFTNFGEMSYTDRLHYAYFVENHRERHHPQPIIQRPVDLAVSRTAAALGNTFLDIVNFYEEPLRDKLSKLKDNWLSESSLCSKYIKEITTTSCSLTKVIALPSFLQETNEQVSVAGGNLMSSSTGMANLASTQCSTCFLTAGGDSTIRYVSVGPTDGQTSKKKAKVSGSTGCSYIRGYHVAGADSAQPRYYGLFQSSETAEVKERIYDPFSVGKTAQKKQSFFSSLFYSKEEEKNPSQGVAEYSNHNACTFSSNERISDPNHSYGITDMLYIPRDTSPLIVTGGHDRLIKIWK
jgi:hypothetical protein